MVSDSKNSEIQIAEIEVRHVLEAAVAASGDAWQVVLQRLMELIEHHNAHGLENAARAISAVLSRINRLKERG